MSEDGELARIGAHVEMLRSQVKDLARDVGSLKIDSATSGQRVRLIWSIIAALGMGILGLAFKVLGGTL